MSLAFTPKPQSRRTLVNTMFLTLCVFVAGVSVMVLVTLLSAIFITGVQGVKLGVGPGLDLEEFVQKNPDATVMQALEELASSRTIRSLQSEELQGLSSEEIDEALGRGSRRAGNLAEALRSPPIAMDELVAIVQDPEVDRTPASTLLTQLAPESGDTIARIESFLSEPPSRNPEQAGIGPALWGTVGISLVCALTALPIGVATAISMVEFRPRRRLPRIVHGFVDLNIRNLAGVPSIVYGVIGLTAFVQLWGVAGNANEPTLAIGVSYHDQFVDTSSRTWSVEVPRGNSPETEMADGLVLVDSSTGESVTARTVSREEFADGVREAGVFVRDAGSSRLSDEAWYYVQIPFGRSVLAGGLTLMLVILPIVIIASMESLRAVPNSLREGALAQGATTWQVVRRLTLPAAVPGIMTGSILAMSRAIGEAAPILVIAGIVYITWAPANLMDEFTAMPLQIYNWAGRPQEAFHKIAASGIIVLLAVLLVFNATAVLIRQKFQKPLQ
ncbi:MAG: PstA family ABC transporter permease [Planctomycetota bacterium]